MVESVIAATQVPLLARDQGVTTQPYFRRVVARWETAIDAQDWLLGALHFRRFLPPVPAQ